jgi:hypothetical protein
MNGLAALLSKDTPSSEAEFWFRAAAVADDIDTMNNLGQLLAGRGETEEARHRGCHLAIRCGIASIEIDSAERMERRLQLPVFLQGSLAVRYRFDILRTLSLRPPTNLADERRLWQAARAVTVLPPVVAPRPPRRPARPRRRPHSPQSRS